jgi:iron-sulfur cluster repair protein YtfE (RIC family)
MPDDPQTANAVPGALALDRRDGLPDALRVLLDSYPRESWESDPGFNALLRFWLDRHLMFRRLLTLLTTDVQARLDDALAPDRFAQGLSRHGGMLVNDLHAHHMIEDTHYFPVLTGKDPRIASGFALLDADHHALDTYLAGFVEAANGALRALDPAGTKGAARDTAGKLEAELTRLTRLIDRHLTDEEELVVPVILHHGTAGLP